MDTKTCTKCGETKPLSEYYKDKSKLSGYKFSCKTCAKDYMTHYRKKNKEHLTEYCKEYNKEYYQTKGSTIRKACKEYRDSNKSKTTYWASKRRASKVNATPPWLTEEQESFIHSVYSFRYRISGVVGREYHVDHIVPLQGENVCGLHVPWNLQVIPAKDNISKSNTYNDW